MDALRGHEADIARFERWALRATEHAAPGDEARLEEALFANVRAERPFALVQVTREGRDGFTLTYPREGVVPQDLAWRSGRSEVLGEVEVAGQGTGEHAQLWVRVQPMESAGTPLVITLSIETNPASAEASR
jgi:hypothetical protein